MTHHEMLLAGADMIERFCLGEEMRSRGENVTPLSATAIAVARDLARRLRDEPRARKALDVGVMRAAELLQAIVDGEATEWMTLIERRDLAAAYARRVKAIEIVSTSTRARVNEAIEQLSAYHERDLLKPFDASARA